MQYRKALAIDPNFVNAYQGIAMDLLYSGKPDEASKELATFSQRARTDGERRTALFALTVVHIDGAKMGKALEDADKQYALGEKTQDVPAMAFDRGLKGNILLEMGKPDPAKAEFERGVKLVEDSNLSQEIKDNTRLVHHYNLTRVALGKKDVAGAEKEADEFRKGASVSKNPQQHKLAHELDGIVALAKKDYEKAIAELKQANQQNPYNLYRLGLAYQGKGDKARAAESFTKAADSNSLPASNYAYIRSKARAASGSGAQHKA